MQVELSGQTYIIQPVKALQQFQVLRRLLPLLPASKDLVSAVLVELNNSPEAFVASAAGMMDLVSTAGPLARAVADMEDRDIEYLYSTLLSGVRRVVTGGMQPLVVPGTNDLLFQDIVGRDQLVLLFHTLKVNFNSFFGVSPGQPLPS